MRLSFLVPQGTGEQEGDVDGSLLYRIIAGLSAAADYDFGAWGDHDAGVGGLLTRGAVADDLDFKAGGVGLLNDLAHGQADERWNAETGAFREGDDRGCLLRGADLRRLRGGGRLR